MRISRCKKKKRKKGHPFVFSDRSQSLQIFTPTQIIQPRRLCGMDVIFFSHDNNINNNNNFLRVSQHQASFDKPDTNCKNNHLKDNLLV